MRRRHIRGKLSAAILVVKSTSSGRPWVGADCVFDLRVDDHPDPIVELRRLIRLQRAYAHANRGDELVSEKKIDEALKQYTAAGELAPEILELPFWQAVTLVVVGREAEAAPIFRRVFAKEPWWADLVPRLPAAGQLPDDPALIARIVALRAKRIRGLGTRRWGLVDAAVAASVPSQPTGIVLSCASCCLAPCFLPLAPDP